jgi:hypothetical protein
MKIKNKVENLGLSRDHWFRDKCRVRKRNIFNNWITMSRVQNFEICVYIYVYEMPKLN